jgi:acyl-CoA thioester hydrolase
VELGDMTTTERMDIPPVNAMDQGASGAHPARADLVVPGLGDFPVRRQMPTRWADNDIYGHVNNVAYYGFFDTAVNGWLVEAAGVDIGWDPAIGVVAETSCRYLREISFPDQLSIGIALEREGRSSVTYQLGVFVVGREGVEPAARAVGRFVHVYVDRAGRRPVPVPRAVRAALRQLRGPGGVTASR